MAFKNFLENLAAGGTGYEEIPTIQAGKKEQRALPITCNFTAEDIGYLTLRMGNGSFEETVNDLLKMGMLLLDAHEKGYEPCLRNKDGDLYLLNLPYEFTTPIIDDDSEPTDKPAESATS